MGLRQGDLLHVAKVTAANRSVGLELAGGLKLTSDPRFLWEEVVYVHGDNRQVVALSALPPVSYKHIPLIGWETPLALNASAAGGRMRSGGGVIASGLGMPGSSRVAFALDGKVRRFQAELALDEEAGLRGSVRFRVFIRRGSGDFEQVFQSEVIRGGDPPVPLRVDLNEASLLVLIVDHADRGDELDYANWLHARLVR